MLKGWLEEKRSEIGTFTVGDVTYVVLSIEEILSTGDIISEARFKVKNKLTPTTNFIEHCATKYSSTKQCRNPVMVYIKLVNMLYEHFKKIKPKYMYGHFSNKRLRKIYLHYFFKIMNNISLVDYNPYTSGSLKEEEEFVLLFNWK